MSRIAATLDSEWISGTPAEPRMVGGYLSRPSWGPIPFVFPVALCGISWLAGGSPRMTDAGFLFITVFCVIGLFGELINFPRRFGIAGILLYGGVLIWFCYDYMTHWFRHDFVAEPFMPAWVVAKSAFFHSVMIMALAVGILIPFGRWFEKIFYSIPEPRSPNFYFGIVVFLSFLGIAPFFVFAYEPVASVFWKMVTFRSAQVQWAVGRSGNLNYNWGGYVAEFLNIGSLGGLLASFYAIIVSRSISQKVICWLLWFHNFMYAYYSGRRGPVLYMVLPVLILLFLKYQDASAQKLQRISFKAYFAAAVILGITLLVVQTQIAFRDMTWDQWDSASMSQVDISDVQGNSMFSEGLTGYEMVPDQVPFFANRYPGEGLIRAIPEFAFWIAVHPIPRALWNNKPVDPLWEWYNSIAAGTGRSGTTISKGLVGWWYFRFGIFGVIEGGLVMGWLMVSAERALQNAQGRLVVIMLSLAFSTWLFRCYRDVGMLELYTIVVGAVFLWVLMRVVQGGASRE